MQKLQQLLQASKRVLKHGMRNKAHYAKVYITSWARMLCCMLVLLPVATHLRTVWAGGVVDWQGYSQVLGQIVNVDMLIWPVPCAVIIVVIDMMIGELKERE